MKKYATADKMADGPKGIVLYALLGIAISLAFGYLVYHKASAVMYDQSLAELKRSADASGAEFRVRLDQMMYGMTQASTEPYIKEAIKRKQADVLSELINRWKKERPYIVNGQGYVGTEVFNGIKYVAIYRPIVNLYNQVIGAQIYEGQRIKGLVFITAVTSSGRFFYVQKLCLHNFCG